jgi:predicted RecB family nuclease
MQTIQDLLRNFNEDSLSKLARPWGERTQKVGKAAAKILRFARAIDSGKEELVQIPKIPPAENYVMFDLEGLPPQLDELEKVFLWGIQVFGVRPGPYVGEIAGGGQEGDKAGWFSFLGAAREIFKEYGDIKFVHWATYEKTKLSTYLKRYGDMDGVGERVMANLLDLLPITQDSIALPLPSYSLKVIEKYVGFKRTQDEYGGDWAMATFIRATELGDDAKRRELLESIRTYNKEDLGATWAVLSWLRTKGA